MTVHSSSFYIGFKITKYPTKLLSYKNYSDNHGAWCVFPTLEGRRLFHVYYRQYYSPQPGAHEQVLNNHMAPLLSLEKHMEGKCIYLLVLFIHSNTCPCFHCNLCLVTFVLITNFPHYILPYI